MHKTRVYRFDLYGSTKSSGPVIAICYTDRCVTNTFALGRNPDYYGRTSGHSWNVLEILADQMSPRNIFLGVTNVLTKIIHSLWEAYKNSEYFGPSNSKMSVVVKHLVGPQYRNYWKLELLGEVSAVKNKTSSRRWRTAKNIAAEIQICTFLVIFWNNNNIFGTNTRNRARPKTYSKLWSA